MIQAVTNCRVPKITLRIGASFGAGEYGMAGRSFDPRFMFSWPNNKLSVMGGEQAGKTMSQVAVESAKRKGEEPNMEMIKMIEKKVVDTYNEEGEALFATARLFSTPICVIEPPFIPESDAVIMHLTPSTIPIPLIELPPIIFLSPSSSPIL